MLEAFIVLCFATYWLAFLDYRYEQVYEFRKRMLEREAYRRTCLHMWRTILRHRRYTLERLPVGTDGKRLIYGKSKIEVSE